MEVGMGREDVAALRRLAGLATPMLLRLLEFERSEH
jgi:hypothetical protein